MRPPRPEASVASIDRIAFDPTSQGWIAGYRIGNGRQRVLGTLGARRLLGGNILLERAHYEISPKPSHFGNRDRVF